MKKLLTLLSITLLLSLSHGSQPVEYDNTGYVLTKPIEVKNPVPETLDLDKIIKETLFNFDNVYNIVEEGYQSDLDRGDIVYLDGFYFHHNTEDFLGCLSEIDEGENFILNGKVYQMTKKLLGNTKIIEYDPISGYDLGDIVDEYGNSIYSTGYTYIVTCNTDTPGYDRYLFIITEVE